MNDTGPAESPAYESESEETSFSEPNPDLVRPGPWRAVDARVQGAPCSFNEGCVPQELDVPQAPGGFDIEAAYPTVRGPIYCALDDDRFECRAQQAIVCDDWR